MHNGVLLEARPFRPFKSSEEYLYAMKEDLAEWLQTMYPHLMINVENFMEKLETGVALCEHANAVKHQACDYVEKKQAKKVMTRSVTGSLAQAQCLIRIPDVKYFSTAKPGTFFARDNVSNFIRWCRTSLEIIECLLFESDDLIMRKNEKHVILCLLEVARRGARFGMLAPMLVQMERQIDREIAADQKKMANDGDATFDDDSDSDLDEDETPMLMYGPVPQIVTNDLKSLDEMVRDLVEKCTCPTQFPMIRVSEGKYRIGDTKVLIFVRILRNHVMVRVGGGWDTLAHYLDKHDPCRCRSQHRTTQGARLVSKPGAADLHGSQVYYDRTPNGSLAPPSRTSRSPSRRSASPNLTRRTLAPPSVSRSRSPTPNFTSTHSTRLKRNAVNSVVGHGNKHVTSIQIPDGKVLKSEASLQISDQLTDHSDTTSEMSDEGYRSLGVIQDKNKPQRTSLYSQNSMEDAEDNEHHIDCIDDLNDVGLRKTQFSQRIYEPSKPLMIATTTTTPTHTATTTTATPKRTPPPHGTWSGGRAKSGRTALSAETFSPPPPPSPFSRATASRRSVSAVERRSVSANTSPTKGRLRQELLQAVKHNEDEAAIVHQVQQLLRKYGSITGLDDIDMGRGGRERGSFRSPRKDLRNTDGGHASRIPAPVCSPKHA